MYGVALTLESARRGFRPLLLERADFGHFTSWNSLRIIHGGLRYLQTLDFRRFRESVAERRWWLRTFPTLVRPLPCLMPLYNRGMRRVSSLRWALKLNDFLSRHRNLDVPADQALPRGRILSVEETLAAFPQVAVSGLRGGALWYDAVMSESQRLVIEMLRWACGAGATALNYVEAEELLTAAGHVVGVLGRELPSGATKTYHAPVVVNCAGPWSRQVARRCDRDVSHLFHPSLAFNLLLDRWPTFRTAIAVTPPRAGARTYFLHPWKGRVFAGTYHAPWHGGPDHVVPREEHIERFLADLRLAIPGFELGRNAVERVHAGLLPAMAEGSSRLAAREVLHSHQRTGGPRGLYSISGVKFTTARRVAEKTLRLICREDQRSFPPLQSDRIPGPVFRVPTADEFEQLLLTDPAAARRVVATLRAEEAVVDLEDLMLRRTDWGIHPHQAADIARRISDLPAVPTHTS